MKNNLIKYLFILFFCFVFTNSYSKELYIDALQVDVDKEKKIVYAKGNVEIKDSLNNIILSEEAEYNKLNGILKTIGKTTIYTSEKYVIEGQDITYDDQKKIIFSENSTKIKDVAGNEINVQMFNYLTVKNMFLSFMDSKKFTTSFSLDTFTLKYSTFKLLNSVTNFLSKGLVSKT